MEVLSLTGRGEFFLFLLVEAVQGRVLEDGQGGLAHVVEARQLGHGHHGLGVYDAVGGPPVEAKRVVQRGDNAKQSMPTTQLVDFLRNTANDPHARRLAYEILVAHDAGFAGKWNMRFLTQDFILFLQSIKP